MSGLKVGIIGAGHIAEKIAYTISHCPGLCLYAVASRSIEKAQDFASRFGIAKAYGSYDGLIADPEVELLYIATPHSHHYAVTKAAIEGGKPCIVEKAFMANARQTEEIFALAKQRGVFVTEAIWTRYQPARELIDALVASGVIGDVKLISATLGYYTMHKERIMKPELCGGALMDVGVYCINFMLMVHDAPIASVHSHCIKENGVDITDAMSYVFEDGVVANLQASAACENDRQGVISGSKGYIVVDNINNPQVICAYAKNAVLLQRVEVPQQITGYEYQFLECKRALAQGLLESAAMPHDQTLRVMEMMDQLRLDWGVEYPQDK